MNATVTSTNMRSGHGRAAATTASKRTNKTAHMKTDGVACCISHMKSAMNANPVAAAATAIARAI